MAPNHIAEDIQYIYLLEIHSNPPGLAQNCMQFF